MLALSESGCAEAPDVAAVFRKREERSTTPTQPCLVCAVQTKLRCQRCKKAAFCGKECLKAGWKAHKRVCSAA
ncbi:unnamed protein product [Heterosigma akashiwo]